MDLLGLDLLPDDMIYEIAMNLTYDDLKTYRRLSTKFKDIIDSSKYNFWKNKLENEFPNAINLIDKSSKDFDAECRNLLFRFLNSPTLSSAIDNNDLVAAKYIIDQSLLNKVIPKLSDNDLKTLSRNNLTNMSELLINYKIINTNSNNVTSILLNESLKYNRLEMLKKLYSIGIKLSNFNICEYVKTISLEVLTWSYSLPNPITINNSCIPDLIRGSRNDVLLFLKDKRHVFDIKTITSKDNNPYLRGSIIKYLRNLDITVV